MNNQVVFIENIIYSVGIALIRTTESPPRLIYVNKNDLPESIMNQIKNGRSRFTVSFKEDGTIDNSTWHS